MTFIFQSKVIFLLSCNRKFNCIKLPLLIKESSEIAMRSAIFRICGKSMNHLGMELMQIMKSIILLLTLRYNINFSEKSPIIQNI